MVAGRGIVHSERTPDEERAAGMRMHGIQTWVALPKTHEDCPPSFTHHPKDTLPEFDLGGARAQLLAGEAWGHRSPVKFPWGIWYLGLTAPGGADFEIDLHTGNVSMKTIASQMGMSRQTLYRQLKQEGTSFDELLDRLRHRLAIDYLEGEKVSVNETAYLVGFSDPSAFSRAFKRWTGHRPSAGAGHLLRQND